MSYITSTLSTSVKYALFGKTVGGMPKLIDSVTLEGGANVATKHFITPEGVVTPVTDAQIELLQQNDVFKTHLENGFVKVHKREKIDTGGLEEKDESAPITPSKYTKRGKKAPKTTTE